MPDDQHLRVLLLDSDEASRAEVRQSLQAAGIDADVSNVTDVEDVLRKLVQERRELLARERSAREQAEAAACARDEFLGTLSHELRTPLNAILGWTRLIAAGKLDPGTIARAADIIDRNARAEVQLIDDLLDMSRLVSGNLKLDMRAISLAEVLELAADTVGPAARAKDITLEIDTSAVPDRIACDPLRVQQIIWNFLSNAVKFTPPGGRISMTASMKDGCVSIAVRDTGVGIKPEFLPFVFDRFRQQDAATTRTQGGLGIGLAIAKHLAELHGGSVAVTSEGEGTGSTFTLTLPCRERDVAVARGAER
jgi:signal transduction histidine kinase